MVKVIIVNDQKYYQCSECGLKYADDSTSLVTGKEWAEKCEAWCKEHKSCNLEIIEHAVKEISKEGEN